MKRRPYCDDTCT